MSTPLKQAERPGEIDQTIGHRIEQRRRALGLSEDHVAEKLGVSTNYYRKLERGMHKLSAARIATIATELDAPPGYFFGTFQRDLPADAQDLVESFLKLSAPLRATVCALVRVAAEETARQG